MEEFFSKRPRLAGAKKQRPQRGKWYRDEHGVACFAIPSRGRIAKLVFPDGKLIAEIILDFKPNPVLIFKTSESESFVIGREAPPRPRRFRTWTA